MVKQKFRNFTSILFLVFEIFILLHFTNSGVLEEAEGILSLLTERIVGDTP